MKNLALTKRTIYIFDKNNYSSYYKKKELSPDYYISINYRFENKERFLDVNIQFKDKNDIFNNFKNLNEKNIFSYLDDEEVRIALNYDGKVSEEPYLFRYTYEKERFARLHNEYESLMGRLVRLHNEIEPLIGKSVPLKRRFRGSLEEGLNEFYILLFSKNIQLDYSINKFIFLRSEFPELLYAYLLKKELGDILKESFLNKDDRLIDKVYNETINYAITYKVKTKNKFLNLTKNFKKIALESGLENFSKEIKVVLFLWKLISFALKVPIAIPLIIIVADSKKLINNMLYECGLLETIFYPVMVFGFMSLCILAWNFIISIPGYILIHVLRYYLILKSYISKRSFELGDYVESKVFVCYKNNSIDDPSFSSHIEEYFFGIICGAQFLIFISVWAIMVLLKSIMMIVSFY